MLDDTAPADRKLVIFGAWSYGRVVAETAMTAGWSVLGFVDPEPPAGTPSLANVPEDARVIVAIGDNRLRSFVQSTLAARSRVLASVVHPSASISPSAEIGAGCHVAENAVVRTGAVIGPGTFVNSGAVVSHDCRLAGFVTFGPNAATGGHVSVGERALVGVGASIRPHARIGDDCTIGAGAAVVDDVEDGVTVVGNPARPIVVTVRAARQSDWASHRIW
jgi:UDP-N-acetylbacillosamine N-acetyltransferase